ncbi:MAG: class I SAM-dependent methyltransferase [Solirubrobacteraceae bacterium]
MSACLLQFKPFLDRHTAEAIDREGLPPTAPGSRYESFRFAFDRVLAAGGRTIVELGTIRSFVHGGLSGCNDDDPAYWNPERPEDWDWGAGCFSLMAAISLQHVAPAVHTVDNVPAHIERCKVVTAPFARLFHYHVCDSVEFLRSLPPGSVDLLYLDTGDMWPIEPTAKHQLREAQALCCGRLLADDGLVLIDDVRNATPRRFGESSGLGKAKYSVPYLLGRGFEIVVDDYQVALTRSAAPRRRRLVDRIVRGAR